MYFEGSRPVRQDIVDPLAKSITLPTAIALYFSIIQKRVDERWPKLKYWLLSLHPGTEVDDRDGIRRVEAVYATMAIGMIFVPDWWREQDVRQVEDAIIHQLPGLQSIARREDWHSYLAAIRKDADGQVDLRAIGHTYLARVGDLRPEYPLATEFTAEAVGSSMRRTARGAWQSILDAHDIDF